jgi:undecaprenyl-diphosphatase
MTPSLAIWQIAILAAIQGAAELLPVSSSAHVIVASSLLGLDPGAPSMTFLIVMLHTGTMFAVLAYFWRRWRARWETSGRTFVRGVVIATAITGVLGFGLKILIEKVILEKLLGHSHGEVEHLFRSLPLVAVNLALVGALIIYAGRKSEPASGRSLNDREAGIIGAVQALCLPLRGFSRSGATISVALLRGIPRALAEDFSFALAVVVTPPVILLQLRRLIKSFEGTTLGQAELLGLLTPGLVGMVFSFVAGWLALRWLSRWLEAGRWQWFGYYCWVASAAVFAIAFSSPTLPAP